MDRNTPLHDACAQGHLNVVAALVKRGADINFKNVNGETPLHIAAHTEHLEVVEYLVDEVGADLSKVNILSNEWMVLISILISARAFLI